MNSKIPKNAHEQAYGEAKSRLFNRIITVSFVICALIGLAQLIFANYTELLSTVLILTAIALSGLLHRKGYSDIAYGVIPLIGFSTLFYMVVAQGSKYEAFLLMFPAAIIYMFIFYSNRLVLVAYFLLSIILQCVLVYFNAGYNEVAFKDQMLAEYMNVLVLNLLTFLMCYFFVSNLKKSKLELDMAVDYVGKQKMELVRRNEELDRYIASNKQLTSYTDLAAHELKAPLRSVQGFAQILERKLSPKIEKSDQELFEIITTNTKKMSALLDDLRKLGKVDKTEIKVEVFGFDELMDEIKQDRRDDIDDRNAEVKHIGEVDQINGQRNLLKQLFSNLIGNAVKFVEADKQPVVHVDSEYQEDGQFFQIMDNGIGISEEDRGRVFQIFTRLHSESEYEGSGIGLALCKKIVDLHKGTITLGESELGGSNFMINLPDLEDANEKTDLKS